MTNFEKYKTADERAEKFRQWCKRHACCSECELDNGHGGNKESQCFVKKWRAVLAEVAGEEAFDE